MRPSNGRIYWQTLSPLWYQRAVDRHLKADHGTDSGALLAENVVSAAQRAGYSPLECASWLARVDGLS